METQTKLPTKPFHESIIDALYRCMYRGEVLNLGQIIFETTIPKEHAEKVSTIYFKIADHFGIQDDHLKKKLQKEAEGFKEKSEEVSLEKLQSLPEKNLPVLNDLFSKAKDYCIFNFLPEKNVAITNQALSDFVIENKEVFKSGQNVFIVSHGHHPEYAIALLNIGDKVIDDTYSVDIMGNNYSSFYISTDAYKFIVSGNNFITPKKLLK